MSDHKLHLATKAGWGVADLGVNIFVIMKQLIIFTFLVQYLEVPAAKAGVLTFSVLIFDVITDPIIGWLSDRTSTRWGRRAPFVFVGAVLMAGFSVLMFAVPTEMVGMPAALWTVGFFILATIGFTMVVIPYGAMSAEMTQNKQERSTMIAFRMASASFGILLAGAVFPMLHGNTREGHLTAALIFAPIIIIAIWTSVFATRKAPRIDQPSEEGIVEQFATTFSNKPFLLLVVIYGIQTIGIAVITAGIPFAALYLITNDTAGPLSRPTNALGIQSVVFACFVVGSMISQFVWARCSQAFGKRAVFIGGSLLYSVVLLAFFTFLPSVNMTAIGLMTLLVGFCNGCYQQLPWAMLPDLIDITSREQDKDQAGAFNAVWLFGQKAANAVGPAFLGFVLGFYGWKSSRGVVLEQPEAAIDALTWAMTLLPAFFLVLSVVIYWALSRRV